MNRPHSSPRLIALAAFSLAGVTAAHATSFGIFQHSGRGTGQVGAFVGRADDATAVTYNPAALVRLDGWQATVGLDFSAPQQDYQSATGSSTANHIINFPPALYLAWHPRDADWAFGLGVDTPYWYDSDWRAVFFPGRFVTRRARVNLFEIHPTAAYALDDRWSVGGGIRYVSGRLADGENALYHFPGEFGDPVPLEVLRTVEANGNGLGFDLAAHFTTDLWGFGASLRSKVDVDGTGDVKYAPGALVDPVLQAIYDRDFAARRSQRLAFTLPTELRAGVWLAPYPELRLEADLGYTRWSELADSSYVFNPTIDTDEVVRQRDWNDILSLRLGAEGDLNEAFSVFGGVAYEPSPVPNDRIEPGFPRGNAVVIGVGGTYRAGAATFDVGYSFHVISDRKAAGQELDASVRSTYSARDQVFAASARFSF
jgi:long-chain fatty acid transport protein